jgi:SAM-dependent methyltransferase
MEQVLNYRQIRRVFTRPFRNLGRVAKYVDFVRNFMHFKRLSDEQSRDLKVAWEDRYPCLGDKTSTTGFDRHYVYHTAWAARTVARIKPTLHVDIASSLFFAAGLSAFLPVKFYDYRPAELNLDNLKSDFADLLKLPFSNQSVESLSCMHVVEHVGLGRYGDPLDPEGDHKAMGELQRVVRPGGVLLFVVPVGRPRVCYNAHRVYSFEQIQTGFPELKLEQFALIPDRAEDGGLILDADPKLVTKQDYACGCFLWRRPL